VVTRGTLVARRGNDPERRISAGEVVGEVAVLMEAPRAASVRATDGATEVLVIERTAFHGIARRAPELVLGLSATLAVWIAPARPDVL
jgi:CRP-like cAMP-binding protein